MSKQPTRAFAAAFMSAMADTAAQVARHEVVVKRMTAAAVSVIAGLAIALTAAAPAPAQAQNTNSVARTAIDVIGGVVGGALGNQIGGGNGRKAATVAGAAAGVWAAEAMQPGSNQSHQGRMVSRNDNFGPAISPGWSNARYTQPDAAYSRSVDRQVLLESGSTQLSDERMSKLVAMEGTFLAARDKYARALYAVDQAADDAVIDSGGKGVQQALTIAQVQQRQAQTEFTAARGTFVNAVQHLGERGYDVHFFAHSYKMSQARVTANDMRRGDVVRATRGARIVDEYDDTNSVRGESYSAR